jgi:hypothetical protein
MRFLLESLHFAAHRMRDTDRVRCHVPGGLRFEGWRERSENVTRLEGLGAAAAEGNRVDYRTRGMCGPLIVTKRPKGFKFGERGPTCDLSRGHLAQESIHIRHAPGER